MRLGWVHGLSPASTGDWRPVVLLVLVGRLGHVEPGGSTIAAERGLGLNPSHYWFISSAKRAFGQAITLWIPRFDQRAPPGGVCPFDTGGLWNGKISAQPSFHTQVERRRYFDKRKADLTGWEIRVSEDVQQRWTSPPAYVRGDRPDKRGDRLSQASTNTDRAWTWEARLERSVEPVPLELSRMVWTQDNRNVFLQWLIANRAELAGTSWGAEKMMSWLSGHQTLHDAPWVAATEHLLAEDW